MLKGLQAVNCFSERHKHSRGESVDKVADAAPPSSLSSKDCHLLHECLLS